MKKGVKKKGGLYTYLDSTKVLETGSDKDIERARRAYWKAYKNEWRQRQRKACKQVTISLTGSEAGQIAKAAKKHMRSTMRFVKESCLAYVRKRYLVPDPLALATIRQLLAMNHDAVQRLFDEQRVPFEVGRTLLSQMAALEQKVLQELYVPKEDNKTEK